MRVRYRLLGESLVNLSIITGFRPDTHIVEVRIFNYFHKVLELEKPLKSSKDEIF